jgi:transposase InsO family protein
MNKYQKKGYIFTSIWDGFPRKPIQLKTKYERWKKIAKLAGLSREATLRLDWIIYYYTAAKENARLTCRHFGIAPKTFYKWFDRFNEANLRTLEDISRAPKNTRKKEYTPDQFVRVVALRKQYIRYGKLKLLKLYENLYPEDTAISSWKIQCIIEKSKIYYHPQKQARINRKRKLSQKRKKITELKMKKVKGFLLCVDTITIYWMGRKRYVITAIDKWSKVAFARMYTTHSSYNSRDFLYRLYYLLDGKIENIQTDNGSEFKKYFEQGCQKLELSHYYSRVKTPKDNPVNERFNRTLQEEFIDLGNMTYDTVEFNRKLTEWLIHYNFGRPHQTLDYMPPINFTYKYHKVLPMYPSSTIC